MSQLTMPLGPIPAQQRSACSVSERGTTAPDDASSLPAGSPAAIEFCLGLTDQGHITAPDLEFDALPLITFFRRPVTFCDHCIRVFLSQGTELQQRTEAVLIGRGARWGLM